MNLSYPALVIAKGDTVTVDTTEAATSDVYFDPYDVEHQRRSVPDVPRGCARRRRSTTTRSTTSTR